MVSLCKTHDQYAHFPGALAHSYIHILINKYKISAYSISDNIETQLGHFMHPSQGLNKNCVGLYSLLEHDWRNLSQGLQHHRDISCHI